MLADDHPAVLDSIARVLAAQGFDVVAQARDGDEALRKIEEHTPQVSIMDVRMPGLSGIAVARRTAGETAVILYTGYSERTLLVEALDAGVRGLVLKGAPLADLGRAIETVAAGEVYVDPVLGGVLVGEDVTRDLTMLTQREREVLRLLSEGLRNDEIGRRLHIGAETVRVHSRKAARKLEADTRTQAVAKALRLQLIE
jgi:DNA-binding NarL/FixJ family response regulator